MCVPTLSVCCLNKTSLGPGGGGGCRGEEGVEIDRQHQLTKHTIITPHRRAQLHVETQHGTGGCTRRNTVGGCACVLVRWEIARLPSPGCKVPTGHRLLQAVICGRAVQEEEAEGGWVKAGGGGGVLSILVNA